MPLLQVNVKTSMPAAVAVTIMLPLADCEPLHAPLAVQDVPLVADQVSVTARPAITLVGLTLIETVVGVIAAEPE